MRSEAEIREALALVGMVALCARNQKDAEAEDGACRAVEVLGWALGDSIGEEFDKTVVALRETTEKHLRAQRQ